MFLNKIQTTILAALSISSVTAFAENDFYVAPFGSYLHSDSSKAAKDGFGAGFAIGKKLNEDFNLEIRGFWQAHDNDYSCCNKANVRFKGDSQLTGGTLDVQYFLMRDTFSPYIVVGGGAMNTDYGTQTTIVDLNKTLSYQKDTTSFIFETGIGTTYAIFENIKLRGDIRYRLNTFPASVGSQENSIFNDLTVNFGLVIPFQNKRFELHE